MVASERVEVEKDAMWAIERIFLKTDSATWAFSRMIEGLVSASDSEKDTKSFVSRGVRAGAYDVVAIAEFDLADYRSLPAVRLPAKTGETENTIGLLDATIVSLLNWFREKVAQGVGLRHHSSPWDLDAILRNAGTVFLGGIQRAWRDDWLRQDLFLSLDAVAAIRHEGEDCSGAILIAPSEARGRLPMLRLQTTVPLHDTHWLRKLLQTSSDGFVGVSDGTHIVGLVEVSGMVPEEGFMVRFQGQHRWSVTAGPQRLLSCSRGFPTFPRQRLTRDRFTDTFARLFSLETRSTTADQVWLVVDAVMKSGHGGLVIVADDADTEAVRLAGQSTLVEPRVLLAHEAAHLSKMDGAILLDALGRCYAFGVILDGLAVEQASRARGARFNSALRYVFGSQEREACVPRLAVVCSEDGAVDLLPHLRIPAKLSDLTRDLESLRAPQDGQQPVSPALIAAAKRVLPYAGDLELSDADFDAVRRAYVGEFRLGGKEEPDYLLPLRTDLIRDP